MCTKNYIYLTNIAEVFPCGCDPAKCSLKEYG